MLETQKRWWKPNLTSIGWHVTHFMYSTPLVWNFVGGIGFTLCGALGYAANVSSGAAYQSALSTFWGGWAFLIGSLLQWYESVNSVAQWTKQYLAGSSPLGEGLQGQYISSCVDLTCNILYFSVSKSLRWFPSNDVMISFLTLLVKGPKPWHTAGEERHLSIWYLWSLFSAKNLLPFHLQ